jgi:DNA-damage-inducible protein D
MALPGILAFCLLDRMDSTELAANQFRMAPSREKLARDGLKMEQGTSLTHEQVGREVRAAIRRIGGTSPRISRPLSPSRHREAAQASQTEASWALPHRSNVGLL